MRFAQETFLYLSALSLLLLGLFGLGALRLHKSRLAFGTETRVLALLTSKTLARRTVKAVLASAAVFFAFLAAAEPQYGKGTRILPATNLDVAVVLDYSKSMYARDVAPYRMSRAKTEVLRLIDRLSGARFGAVAFAGEPISYPLTSDAAAIKQFFRSFDPNDMAVGGTAIARALDSAKDLLLRDPKSQTHEKIIVLVTDGEDLEGDPVSVAETAKAAGIQIHVVQIGGKSPEPIPEVDPSGKFLDYRKDASGEVLTTALTTEGEAQLRAVADSTGGTLTLAAKGEVGVDALSERLRSHMTEELSEKVETVYADVFEYPLALAILLLAIEAFLGTSAFTPPPKSEPKGLTKRRKPRRLVSTATLLASLGFLMGCDPVDRMFTRKSPVVEDAIAEFHEKRFPAATKLLTDYLETGECKEGVIGAGDRAKKFGDASFDLALALATPVPDAKQEGLRASPIVPPAASAAPPGSTPGAASPGASAPAAGEIDCALRLLSNVADDPNADVSLRAAALYLMGNLELKRNGFKPAVASYDRALLLAPGASKERNLDPLGIDIAHNRALALRLAEEEERKREEEKKKDEPKKDDEKKNDGEKKSDEPEKEEEKKDEPKKDDEKKNDGSEKNESKDEKKPEDPKKNEDRGEEKPSEENRPSEPETPKDSSASQDQRILDLLEQAPTLQEQEAKNRARGRVRRTMEDK